MSVQLTSSRIWTLLSVSSTQQITIPTRPRSLIFIPKAFDQVNCHHGGTTPADQVAVGSYQKGYARLAAYLECDANFSIVRKYGWLHNRVLLHLQAELGRLERGLQELDDRQIQRGPYKERVGLWCDGRDKTERKEMLAEIKTKLAEYDDLVFRLQKKNAMKRPIKTSQESVMKFVFQSVVASEADWIYHRTDDLVALASDVAEQDWFNFVMGYARDLAPRLFRVRPKNFLRNISSSELMDSSLLTFSRASSSLVSGASRLALSPPSASSRQLEWMPSIAQS